MVQLLVKAVWYQSDKGAVGAILRDGTPVHLGREYVWYLGDIIEKFMKEGQDGFDITPRLIFNPLTERELKLGGISPLTVPHGLYHLLQRPMEVHA